MRHPFCLSSLIAGVCLSLTACPPADGSDDAGPPAPVARVCQEACDQTSECNTDFECQSHRCVYTGATVAATCSDNASCTPIVSGWTELVSCDASTPCSYGVCVDVSGQGHCVIPPPCTAPQTEVEWADIGGNPVQVCGKAGYACDEGACYKPCQEGDCGGATPLCGSDGRCRCESGSCTGQVSGEVCLDTGRCGCASDADCTAEGADVCVTGVCGCAGEASCTAATVHSGTRWVCEAL